MSLCFPPFGEIVINFIRQNEIIVTHFFGKTQSLKLCPLYLFVFSTHLNPNIWISSFTYSIVKFHLPLPCVVSLFLHHREMIKQSSLTSPEFGAALCAVVGLDGLEPSTSRLSGARSSHLSYRPVFLSGFSVRPSLKVLSLMVEMKGFEPLTPCLQGRCSLNWATPPFGDKR